MLVRFPVKYISNNPLKCLFKERLAVANGKLNLGEEDINKTSGLGHIPEEQQEFSSAAVIILHVSKFRS